MGTSLTPESMSDLLLGSEETTLLLSGYCKKVNGQFQRRCVNEISENRIDPFLIPKEKLAPELSTADRSNFCPKKQLKAFRSLQAYNQMVSGFIQSVDTESRLK